MVVDEEIYRRLPTLLIATVDKFAQMPWNGAVQMLFGQVNGRCSRHGFRSPEIEDKDSHPRTKTRPATGDHSAASAPATARSYHSGRIAPDQRAAGYVGRTVRNGHRQALHLGSQRQEGAAQGHRLDGHDPQCRRAGSQALSAEGERLPAHGLDVRDNFFSLQREPSEEYPGRLIHRHLCPWSAGEGGTDPGLRGVPLCRPGTL